MIVHSVAGYMLSFRGFTFVFVHFKQTILKHFKFVRLSSHQKYGFIIRNTNNTTPVVVISQERKYFFMESSGIALTIIFFLAMEKVIMRSNKIAPKKIIDIGLYCELY